MLTFIYFIFPKRDVERKINFRLYVIRQFPTTKIHWTHLGRFISDAGNGIGRGLPNEQNFVTVAYNISDVLYIYHINVMYLQTDAASADPTNTLLKRTRLFVVVAIVVIIRFDITRDIIRYFIIALAARLQHVYYYNNSKLLQRLKIYLYKSFINLNQ